MEKIKHIEVTNKREDQLRLLHLNYLELIKNVRMLQEFNIELDEILLEIKHEKENIG